MLNNDIYRYTIQFPAKSKEAVRAGEFLEKCKSKKGKVIVQAINELLDNHPEILEKGMVITQSSSLDEEEIKSLVERLIDEKLLGLNPASDEAYESTTEDVSEMLDNLDLF